MGGICFLIRPKSAEGAGSCLPETISPFKPISQNVDLHNLCTSEMEKNELQSYNTVDISEIMEGRKDAFY